MKKQNIILIFSIIIFLILSFVNFCGYTNGFEKEIERVYNAKINGNDAIVNVDFLDKHHYTTIFYEYCEPLIIGGCRNKSQSITIKIK